MKLARSLHRCRASWVHLTVVPAVLFSIPALAQEPLPWEVWKDLGELARLKLDHRVFLQGSRCPDGCQYDRHSDGDSRFVRTIGDEGVIFEAEGAGAITRIWMTQGDGVSQTLDENIRLRLTLDGAIEPVIDLPLPEVFGATAPFEPPLAVDRTISSGGNTSYVPMAFRDGCRLSLVGAETAKIWFQVGGHHLASAEGVTTFTGTEDLSGWRAMLDSAGSDPWPDGPTHSWVSGTVAIEPGETEVLVDMVGPDTVTALRIDVPQARWDELVLTLDFDGEQRTEMAVSDFFAIGRAPAVPTRSLMVGVDETNVLYSFFPMPFFRSAKVALGLAESAVDPVAVDFIVRRRNRSPARDSGLFGAELRVVPASVAGRDSAIVELDGPGRWVGLFLEVGGFSGSSKSFLEGDERIHLDSSPHPALYGTGVEDFFGGGFYYRIDSMSSIPFRKALHGMTYELTDSTGLAMGMYRLMLSDAPVFGERMVVGLEGGPVNQTAVRMRAVAYAYLRRTPPLRRRDMVDLGDAFSRFSHLYIADGDPVCGPLSALFESEPPLALTAEACRRDGGNASFVFRGAQPDHRLVLRRRLDVGEGDQRAAISVSGMPGPSLAYEDANPYRRWRERETLLGSWNELTDEVALTVTVPPIPGGFTESTWELWAGYPPGTCDVVLDGVCDAADVAEGVRAVDNGGTVEDLALVVTATFD